VTNSAYAEQWKRMQRVRRRPWLYFLIGLIVFIFNHFFIDPTNQGSLGLTIFTAAWFSLFLWAVLERRNIHCPRCGKLWYGGVFQYTGPFPRHRCSYCGLKLP